MLSYFILTFYDRLGTIYAGHKVSYGRVAFASFCAYALSHNLGFAAVSGAAVRYRLYAHWGLTPLQIGKTVAFCSLTFGLGGMVLGGAHPVPRAARDPVLRPRICRTSAMYARRRAAVGDRARLRDACRACCGRVRLFGHTIELPGWRMAMLQVLLATVDVAVTATIFYALLPAAPGLTWLIFLGVYVASYTAGLAANLPGGIGVFDTAMLFGLEPYVERAAHRRRDRGVPPLLLRHSAVPGRLPVRRQRDPAARRRLLRSARPTCRAVQAGRAAGASRTSPSPPPPASVALCGVLLLCLGVLAPQTDFSWLDPDFAETGDAGRPVRAVADRRRAGDDGDRRCRIGSTSPGA